MPKYLLLKHYRGGPEPHRAVPPMDQWAPEDVDAHIAFLKHVSELLEENGEYVDAQALTPARTWVRLRRAARALSAAATCRLQSRSLFTYFSELIAAETCGDPFPALT
jgi:hypothetical protein